MRDLFAWLWSIDPADVGGESVGALTDELFAAFRGEDAAGVAHVTEQLIGLGDASGIPWLGVFGRHWALQYRINHMNEGAVAVRDAVVAFEQSRRPENAACPQSTCATQDLALAYSAVDAPGYAAEVVAACRDTLAEIDPTWPCYDCVMTELVGALGAAGHHAEQLDEAERAMVDIRAEGVAPTLGFESYRLEALLALGSTDRAHELAVNVATRRYAHHSNDSVPSFALVRARALVAAGAVDEAVATWRATPPLLERVALAPRAIRLADDLVAAGALADDDDLARLRVELAKLHLARGAFRKAFDFALSEAAAAARSGAVSSAQRALALAVTAQASLRDPASVDDAVRAVERLLADVPATVSAHRPSAARVEALLAAVEAGDLAAMTEVLPLLTAQGWSAEASRLAGDLLVEHPDDDALRQALFHAQLAEDDFAGAERTIDAVRTADPVQADWFAANLAARRADWSTCAACCAAIVDRRPEAVNTRRLWSFAALQLGELDTSADLAAAVLDLEAEPTTDDRWTAIVRGSLVSRWALVRRVASALGMPVDADSDAPIDEFWGPVEVVLVDDRGREQVHYAYRTGPATARIQLVLPSGEDNRFGDVVVFEPSPLTPPPQDAEDTGDDTGDDWIPTFRSLATIHRAAAPSFLVTGPQPADDEWAHVRDGLRDAGHGAWMYAPTAVQLPDGTDVVEMCLYVSTLPSRLDDLAASLAELTAGWANPPRWPDLDDRLAGGPPGAS